MNWTGGAMAVVMAAGLGGCTLDLIDDAISNEMQVSFTDADRLEIRADSFRSLAEVSAAADKACGVPATPLSREDIPGESRYFRMTFRCERPPPFPPPRDNTPLPEVLRQPRN